MNLEELRERINAIDIKLLELLNERMKVVQEVGHFKKNEKSVIYRPEREQWIIDRLDQANDGLISKGAIEAVFMEIFAISRNFELPELISYLGPEGSFTHQAAESRFGATSEYISLPSIRSIFESVVSNRARFGVVPIENNREGSVAETVDYLSMGQVQVVAEMAMPIHFTFASREDKVSNIKKIYSKDIAIRQCKKFIQEYFGDKVELVEVSSTSNAAKLAAQEEGTAAICSHIAAKLYNVPVLFQNVEDSQDNRTKFFIIAKDFENKISGNDKTSIIARSDNTPGSLAILLNDFKNRNINLTKIESRPAKQNSEFKYVFYIEFDGHIRDENIQQLIESYKGHITWLGSYVRTN